jgi:hypothetical protein
VRGELDERVSASVAVDVGQTKVPALAQLDGAVAQLFDRLTQPVAKTRSVFNWALRGRSA